MKKGLVLEGGGLRGIFTAGVLDVLMEEGIEFDGAVGVSAGAAFGCNYKSKQQKRTIRYNLKYAKDQRYSSLRSLLSTGDLFNAQFCYHDIPEKLFPFDWKTFRENPMEFYLVCTDVETGKPVYHLCGDEPEWEMMEWFRASGSMPLVSRVVEVGGYKLLDGGIADSIPLLFMEKQGYERNLVILTRPAGYIKRRNPMMRVISRALHQYPEAVKAMEKRHLVYNEALAYIRQRESGKFCFVIRPETDLDIGRVEHDRIKIRAAYKEGRRTARRLLPEIRRFLAAADASDSLLSAKTVSGTETAADLSAPKTAVNIPAPKTDVNIPGPKAAADISAPKAAVNTPAPEAAAEPEPGRKKKEKAEKKHASDISVPETAVVPEAAEKEDSGRERAKGVTILKEAPSVFKETLARVRKKVPAIKKSSAQKSPDQGLSPEKEELLGGKASAEKAAAAVYAESSSGEKQYGEVNFPSIPRMRRHRRAWRPGEMTALKQRIGWERSSSQSR